MCWEKKIILWGMYQDVAVSYPFTPILDTLDIWIWCIAIM